ncbi:MAG: PilZ domain-containing protein [Acidobacteria bacterium]|nr:PilZ domain-containing protein [Acidobacteriota bacterium]
MLVATSNENRKENRAISSYPRSYIKIKALDDYEFTGGLIVDSSISGLGVVTSLSIPIGEKVAISLDDEYFATGEVVSIEDEWGDWEWSGMMRLGIKLVDKDNWPV